MLGDSLSAAYGIPQARGWVALLEERLEREQLDYSVVNASVSGDTTAGGLARLDPALKKHQPRIVLVELGGNDGLRGLPVQQLRANLARIIEKSQQAGARVVLVGMKMPPNYGPDYTQAFESAYGELAKRYQTALVPFFLEDLDEAQFQGDRIHPTAEAQPLMLERVWKVLRPLLK